MTTGRRDDYLHRHNFKVEIGGLVQASFHQVEGLDYGYEMVEYAEGGDPDWTRKFPGQGRAGNIILRWGLAPAGSEFLDWLRTYHREPENRERKNGSIILCDDRGREQRRWNFTRSWPVRWRGPALDSARGSREVAIEEIEIAVETLEAPAETGEGEAESGD